MRVTVTRSGDRLEGGQVLRSKLEALKDGVPHYVDFTPVKRNERSPQQNNYYWGVIIESIAEHGGYAPEDKEGREDIHRLMKAKFLPEKKIQYKGDRRFSATVPVDSTTDLSTQEFSQFADAIRRWAAQHLDLNIPDPNATTSLSPTQ